MKNKIKISLLLIVLLAIATVMIPFITYAGETEITNPGGITETDEMKEDGVLISKTIEAAKNNKENYFDITLKIQTETKVDEIEVDQDIALVLVVDRSYSMKYCMDSTSSCKERNRRIDYTRTALHNFADEWFGQQVEEGVTRKLGLVTFSNSASQVISFDSNASKNKNDFLTQVDSNKLNPDSYTNIQAGLLQANTMLENVTNSKGQKIKNKYIILLTDGYPTKLNGSSQQNTTYLNAAAIAARETAEENKEDGIKTYTIGVGVGTQNTMTSKSTAYEIGYTYSNGTYTASPTRFKEWLGGRTYQNGTYKNSGIGYIGTDEFGNNLDAYIDVSNQEELESVYTEIFKKIKQEVDILNKAWTVTDPMNALSMSKYITFEGFYDGGTYNEETKEYIFSNDIVDLLNDPDGNLASFVTSCEGSTSTTCRADSIDWNVRLSEPAYTIPQENNKSTYVYMLKYRIKLNNEIEGFVEGDSYNTNSEAILKYAVLNEKGEIERLKDAEFKTPAVKGYLGELEFTKEDKNGKKLTGAEFYLIHDDTNCGCDDYTTTTQEKEYYHQELDENGRPIDERYIAVSDENGKVTFSNIPSGHKYILKEITPPANYILNTNTYTVTVVYDEVTVNNNFNYKFINTVDKGYIIVRKTVMDDYIDTNQEFEFKLTTNDKDTYNTIKVNQNNGEITGTDGTITSDGTFKLKANEAIKITLNAGSHYKIEEINNTEYDVKYTNAEGDVLQQQTISIDVENTKKPVTVKAVKLWENTEGYTVLPDITLTLYKKLPNVETWTKVEDVVLNDNKGWYYIWEELKGEYEYKVDEDSIPEFFLKDVNYNDNTHTWEITNTNTLSVALPKTGSSATLILILMGISLMLFPFVYKFKECLACRGALNTKQIKNSGRKN